MTDAKDFLSKNIIEHDGGRFYRESDVLRAIEISYAEAVVGLSIAIMEDKLLMPIEDVYAIAKIRLTILLP